MSRSEPFNLDRLLGEKDVRHYLRFIQPGGDTFVVTDEHAMGWDEAPGDPRRLWIPDAEPAPDVLGRRGSGPVACSPSGTLAILPEWVWDACGYYKRLGVHWSATRKQLVQAYRQLVGHDQMADRRGRLTYALHQLLNPVIRRAYDLLPLGQLFMWDRPTREALKAAAARRASKETAERGELVETTDVLQAWGFRRPDTDDNPPPPGSAARQQAQSDPEVAPGEQKAYTLGGSPQLRWRLDWSWYERGECPQPMEWLEKWQQLLITAFRDASINVPFAVGLCADSECDVLPPQDDRPLLCLLGTRPPDPYQASIAVKRVKAIIR